MLIADSNFGTGSVVALAAGVVPVILALLFSAARRETLAATGARCVCYPRAMRTAVVILWVFTAGFAVVAALRARGAERLDAAMCVLTMACLVMSLHLEAFGALITWDGRNIYAQSAWRKPRTIPISSVKACDYSHAMQWYRIYTDGFGIVRLHYLMRGVPDLLQVLPCSTPPYPPLGVR